MADEFSLLALRNRHNDRLRYVREFREYLNQTVDIYNDEADVPQTQEGERKVAYRISEDLRELERRIDKFRQNVLRQ